MSYRVFVRDGLIWRRHSQQLKSRVRALFPSLNRSNEDAINVPVTNADEENLPIQRRSVRARRQPERLNYDILGGQN